MRTGSSVLIEKLKTKSTLVKVRNLRYGDAKCNNNPIITWIENDRSENTKLDLD